MAEQGAAGPPLLARIKLEGELAHWRRLNVKPRIWWRDDDARTPSPALDRLLQLADGRPLALAVIPDVKLAPLAARLAGERNIRVGQHGVDHINRRPAGEAPSEYARQPTVAEIAARLSEGRRRMTAAGLSPAFFTPPWNAVDPGLAEALVQIGVPTLSAGEVRVPPSGLTYLSAEIDLLRWRGGARFKGGGRIVSMLSDALTHRRRSATFDRPVGLLTHHLDHDDATWRFLAWMLPYLDRRFEWVGVDAPRYGEMKPNAGERYIDAMAKARRVC